VQWFRSASAAWPFIQTRIDQESILTTAYELLEKLPSGEFVWLATVERLADAERLLGELCTNSPDGNFVISDGNAEVCTPP
jgi:hypothetical protein